MKHTYLETDKKLTKRTNSFPSNRGGVRVTKQTHLTQKLTEKNGRDKLTKLMEKTKLTFYLATLRRLIAEISNYIRYLFFLSEYVSLLYLKTCEEKIENVNIQYRNRPGQTHQTHKLTLPAGAV